MVVRSLPSADDCYNVTNFFLTATGNKMSFKYRFYMIFSEVFSHVDVALLQQKKEK